MADWIKMRSSLLTNPKVIRMARVLLQDPEFMEWLCPGRQCADGDASVTKRDIPVVTRVVVGALLPTWSAVNDTAARDGVVRHATSQDIDESAGVPGFGKALMAVEWLEELPGGDGVRFVNFEEHNSPQKERSLTAKPGAVRTKEYRDRKRLEASGAGSGDGQRDEGRDSAVTSQRDDREEESREEKKGNTPLTPQGGSKPPRKARKRSRAPLSADDLPPWMKSLRDLYEEVLPELPGVEVMNAGRKQAAIDFRDWVLSTSRRDGSRRATNDEEMLGWAREFFERARASDFIMGRGKRSAGHENWRCSFEYLLSANGMQKVIEQTQEPVT